MSLAIVCATQYQGLNLIQVLYCYFVGQGSVSGRPAGPERISGVRVYPSRLRHPGRTGRGSAPGPAGGSGSNITVPSSGLRIGFTVHHVSTGRGRQVYTSKDAMLCIQPES
jgi:hypothetical protein